MNKSVLTGASIVLFVASIIFFMRGCYDRKTSESEFKSAKESFDNAKRLSSEAVERLNAARKDSEQALQDKEVATRANAEATEKLRAAQKDSEQALQDKETATRANAEATEKLRAAQKDSEQALQDKETATRANAEAAKQLKAAREDSEKARQFKENAERKERQVKEQERSLNEEKQRVSKHEAELVIEKKKVEDDKKRLAETLLRVGGPREIVPMAQHDVESVLLLINHVNWVVTKIKNANDPIVLEEEYNAINQNALYLDAIKDREVVSIVCHIMDHIMNMRIDAKEREMLQEELDQGMADAIYEAIPNPTQLFSLNPVGSICNLATSAVSSYSNYRKAKARLDKQFKKATWDLDKNKMDFLNELNKNLLRNFWELVRRYGLQDKYRVVESDIEHLIERLKDDNPRRTHVFLSTSDAEERYRALPQYWYYRGSTAYQCGFYEDAERSLVQYQSYLDKHGDFLRQNKMSAHAAMIRLNLAARQTNGNFSGHEEDVRIQLKVIEKHSIAPRDWQALYYAAVVYDKIGDVGHAKEILVRLIDEFEADRNKKVIDWKQLVVQRQEAEEENKIESVSATDSLYMCKRLLAEIMKQGLDPKEAEKIMEDISSNQSNTLREQLLYFGEMGYGGALDKLLSGAGEIRAQAQGETLYLNVPLSWTIAKEHDFHVYVQEQACDLKSVSITDGIKLNEDVQKREIRPLPDDPERDGVLMRFEGGEVESKSVILTVLYAHGERMYRMALRFPKVGGRWSQADQAAFGEWLPHGGPEGSPKWGAGVAVKEIP